MVGCQRWGDEVDKALGEELRESTNFGPLGRSINEAQWWCRGWEKQQTVCEIYCVQRYTVLRHFGDTQSLRPSTWSFIYQFPRSLPWILLVAWCYRWRFNAPMTNLLSAMIENVVAVELILSLVVVPHWNSWFSVCVVYVELRYHTFLPWTIDSEDSSRYQGNISLYYCKQQSGDAAFLACSVKEYLLHRSERNEYFPT